MSNEGRSNAGSENPDTTVGTADQAIYANGVNVAINTYDFALTFTRSDPNSNQNKMCATVYLSPQQARALQLLLGRFVNLYQENFGAIALPSELEKQMIEGPPTEQGN